MIVREFNLRLGRTFVLVLSLVAVDAGRPGAASQGDLLASLVEKNEAAWQKIQSLTSIQYTLERQWLDKRSQQPFQGVAQVKKKGNRLWSVYRFQISTGPLQVVNEKEMKLGNHVGTMQLLEPDIPAFQVGMSERWVVVNDQYMVVWPGPGNPLAYRDDYNSMEEMRPALRADLKRELPWDFLHACFGEDTRRFPEGVRTASGRRKYEAVEVAGTDGNRLYQIRLFSPIDARRPAMVWLIDPQKGFLATECAFAIGGVPVSRRTMRVEQIAPEVWYPVQFEETRYAEPNQPGDPPKIETWSKVALKDIRVNMPIPDEQFDIEAFGLQNGKPVTVMRTTVDGRTIPYVYREGKFVPRD